MFRFTTLAVSTLLLAAALTAQANPPPVTADRNSVAPGQAVNLTWHFTGKKIVASGGSFGKGLVVTNKRSVTDRPKKTTRYAFTVYYEGLATSPKTKKRVKMPLQARYEIVIQVLPVPTLSSYYASRGWNINYLKGWKPEAVTTPQVGKNGLVYFQPEDDAVERLAVAMVPATGLTTQELMQRISVDIADKYAETEIVKQQEILYQNAPALWVNFTGRSNAHEGLKTQSVILAFVADGQAYFVSARTAATQFAKRQTLLETMVKSMTLPASAHSTRTIADPKKL